MNGLSMPPWGGSPDEIASVDPAGFGACQSVVQGFASKAGGQITGRRYSVSKEWGKILRARMTVGQREEAFTMLLTCWSRPGEPVEIVLQAEGCCGGGAQTP
jgi:hypothetical protein